MAMKEGHDHTIFFVGCGSMSLSVGSKVEAKDFSEDWHPAEIIEVDYDDMEVLVHYEHDKKRYVLKQSLAQFMIILIIKIKFKHT